MFLPKFLQQNDHEKILELIRDFPFATLVVNTEKGVEVDHLPLFIEKDSNSKSLILLGHLAKVNSLCKSDIIGDAKIVFHGPNSYISPNWYPSKKEHGKAVPTWNYLVVHITGPLELIHDEQWKYELLEKQSAFHEQGLSEQWKLTDAPDSYIRGMLKGIVGVRIGCKDIIAKWKVSKEKSDADKQGVIEGLQGLKDEKNISLLVDLN